MQNQTPGYGSTPNPSASNPQPQNPSAPNPYPPNLYPQNPSATNPYPANPYPPSPYPPNPYPPKKSRKKLAVVLSVTTAVIVALVVIGLTVVHFSKSSGKTHPHTSATKKAAAKASGKKDANPNAITFNTNLDLTSDDLKLTGKSVPFKSPCGQDGKPEFDATRPYVFCRSYKKVYEINPDGSTKMLATVKDGLWTSPVFGLMVNDDLEHSSIYDIAQNKYYDLGKHSNSNVLVMSAKYLLWSYYDDASFNTVHKVIDRTGKVVETLPSDFDSGTPVFVASPQNSDAINLFLPEQSGLIATSALLGDAKVINVANGKTIKAQLPSNYSYEGAILTGDGFAFLSTDGGTIHVTAYNNDMEQQAKCSFPGDESLASSIHASNEQWKNLCDYMDKFDPSKLKENQKLFILPNGMPQIWERGADSSLSYKGVSHPGLTDPSAALGVMDHGNVLLTNQGILNISKSDPVISNESKWILTKQMLITDSRIYEVAPAD